MWEKKAGDNASKMLSTAPGTRSALRPDRKLLLLLAVVVQSWQLRRSAPQGRGPTHRGLEPAGPSPPHLSKH